MWRIHFLLFEAWGKNISVILYTLFPFIRANLLWREEFLEKRGYIKIDKKNKSVKIGNLQFQYTGELPVADVISLLLPNDSFIQKNFIQNSAFRIEGPYEMDGVQICEGDAVIDIGANIGLFSIYAAQKAGELGKVYACEPIEKTLELLQKNIFANNCGTIQILPYAIGLGTHDVMFSVNDAVLGDSTKDIHSKGRHEQVTQYSLDDLVARENIIKVDFIKADIEGMEKEMLAGAKETIKKFRPKIAICTYHFKDDPEKIEKIIRDLVPEYNISKTKMKLFAWCEKDNYKTHGHANTK